MLLIKTKNLITCSNMTAQVNVQEMGILIDGDKICQVDESQKIQITPDLEVLDASSHYVLPGLIDAHLHLSFSASAQPLKELFCDHDDTILLRMAKAAQTELKSGVTTVRDCGAKGMSILNLKKFIDSGEMIGPDILAAGMPITITGGHCYFCGLEADSPGEVQKAVRMLCKQGVDFIKVMVSGGNMTPGSHSGINQYEFEILKIIVDEAHQRGKTVSGHVHSVDGMKSAIMAGFDTLEHCSFKQGTGTDIRLDLIQQMVERGIGVIPAMGKAYILPPEMAAPLPEKVAMWGDFQKSRFSSTEQMYQSGVKIIAGTDAGCKNTRFDELYLTLQLMNEKIHMTKEDVLLSATAKAADMLGISQYVGTIEPGKQADLLVVEKNPLESLLNLKTPVTVLKKGRRVSI